MGSGGCVQVVLWPIRGMHLSGSRKFRAGGGSLIIGALALMATLLSIAPLSAQDTSGTIDGPLMEVDRLIGSLGVTSAEVGVYPTPESPMERDLREARRHSHCPTERHPFV